MKISVLKVSLLLAVAAGLTMAQSSDQNFPTPITSNELTGTIRARDIGDARLTTYYYAFDGRQGDIFVNVVTRNFSGDIDIFNADGLRPLTKMVIYADSVSETGRLIYLRKSEKLLLRIQGRSPNDDPAAFVIKFGGSFIALAAREVDDAPTVERSDESRVRVNSVGTRLPPLPKREPEPKPVETTVVAEEKSEPVVAIEKPETKEPDEEKPEPVKVVSPAKKPSTRTTRPPRARTTTAAKPPTPKPPPAQPKPDPLASIRLVIQLKEGEVIERPMSEVLRFSVDKGVLTVIGRDGKIAKYSILNVAKVTIE